MDAINLHGVTVVDDKYGGSHQAGDYMAILTKFAKFLKSLPNIHQISPDVFLSRQTFSVFTLLSQYGGNDVSCSFFTVTSPFYHNAV